jgi:hypothetical protein
MRIVIDGYNLLKAIPACRHREDVDPQGARHLLISQLGRYHWLRGHDMTVIFDGWRDGHPLQHHSQCRGVRVIYSQRGEQADDVIRRMASYVAHQGIIVTSDRSLADTLVRLGADVMDSKAFGERLHAALQDGERGKERNSTPDTGGQALESGQKKGRARHPSRAARQRDQKLRNL